MAADDGDSIVDAVDPFDFAQDALQYLLEIKGGDCPLDDQGAVAQGKAELIRPPMEMGMSCEELTGGPVWR